MPREAELHLVAADHFDLVELVEQAAGLAKIADRPGAIGRPLPELPFDAGVIAAEHDIAERGEREDRKSRQHDAARRTARGRDRH